MRAALFFLVILVLGASGSGCTRANCQPTNADRPAHDVRFAVALSRGSVSQIQLLEVVPATDDTGHPLDDGAGHALLDPDVDPALEQAAATIAPAASYFDRGDGHAFTAQIWIDQSTRWPGIRGLGLGPTPVLPPGPSLGPFVTVGTASTVAHFTLEAEDATYDAGAPTGDAGPPPAQRSHFWEFPFPALATPLSPGTAGPVLADLVVAPRYLPNHDLAAVARSVVSDGGNVVGGELFVLDIDDPAHVISLATISFDGYATSGLHAAAAGLVYVPYGDSDGLLFVALDHQSFVFSDAPMYGDGLVAVVDVGMRSVRTLIRMPTLRNCTQIARYLPPTRVGTARPDPGEDHRLVLTCAGSAPDAPGGLSPDAGFAYIEYDTAHFEQTPVVAQTITASSLVLPRPDGGTVPLFGHWVAYVSRGSASPQLPDRVIIADLGSGEHQIVASVLANNGTSTFGLGRSALDETSGVLVVPNGLDGAYTWQVPRTAAVVERSASYQYPAGLSRAVTTCAGHLPARVVRAISGGTSLVPETDAGVLDDAALVDDGGPADDAAVVEDAFVARDAGTAAVDANVDAR